MFKSSTFLPDSILISGERLLDPNASFAFKIYGKFLALVPFFKAYFNIVGTILLFNEVSFNLFSFNLSYSE